MVILTYCILNSYFGAPNVIILNLTALVKGEHFDNVYTSVLIHPPDAQKFSQHPIE